MTEDDLPRVGIGPRCGWLPRTHLGVWLYDRLISKHGYTQLTRRTRDDLLTLQVGDVVDVLLDSGDIVRTTVRHVPTRCTPRRSKYAGWSGWAVGLSSSYALGRFRRAGGWRRVPGCEYLTGVRREA